MIRIYQAHQKREKENWEKKKEHHHKMKRGQFKAEMPIDLFCTLQLIVHEAVLHSTYVQLPSFSVDHALTPSLTASASTQRMHEKFHRALSQCFWLKGIRLLMPKFVNLNPNAFTTSFNQLLVSKSPLLFAGENRAYDPVTEFNQYKGKKKKFLPSLAQISKQKNHSRCGWMVSIWPWCFKIYTEFCLEDTGNRN